MFKKKKEAELNRNSLLSAGICFLVLNLYMFLRFRWGMFDIYCPTFQLNLLGKVSQYGSIVDHVGIPGIPFNYHYLPSLIASIFVNLGFTKILSLYFAITLGLNFTFLIIILYSRKLIYNLKKLKNISGFLFLLTCLFSSSGYVFTLLYPYVGYWSKYLSIAEYAFSFSFPYAFLLLSIQFILLRNPRLYKNSSNNLNISDNRKYRYLVSSFITIIFPYINPTVFVVSSLSQVLYFFKELFLIKNPIIKNKFKNKLSLFFVLCLPILVAVILSKYFIISAFFVSELYERPITSIGPKRFYDIFMFVILLAPTFYLSIITLPTKINLEKISIHLITAIISFIFPFIIYVEGIGFWDNTHKYVLIASFASIFILIDNLTILTEFKNPRYYENYIFGIFVLKTQRGSFRKRMINSKIIFIIIFTLNIFLSLPSLTNQFIDRMSGQNIFAYTREISNISDSFSKYLLNIKLIYKNQKVLFVPLWSSGMCDNFMDIVSTNNNFYALGAYPPNSPFLLSKKIEDNNAFLLNNRHDFNRIKTTYPNHKIIYISNNNFLDISNDNLYEIEFKKTLEKKGSLGQYTIYSFNQMKSVNSIQ